MNEQYKGYSIRLDYETEPSNPLDWSTAEERGAWFLLKHNRYNLPWENNGIEIDDFNSWTELGESLNKPYRLVRWYEHSGISVSLHDSEAGARDWDAGIVGIIYGDTTDDINAAFKAWKTYIEGDVYYITVKDMYGNEIEDSGLGDVFGYDGALEEARMMIDDHIKQYQPSHNAVSARALHL